MMRYRHAELCLSISLVVGCSGRDLVIGGDPEREAAQTPAAGSSGTDAGTGGAAGSSSAGSGAVIGSSGGSSGAGAEGGAPTGDDPYPPVAWENGTGYRTSCPSYENTWGFTCWSLSDVATSCETDGDPPCNACSCAVPCDQDADCPLGRNGEAAVCAGSSTTVRSCFISCEGDPCPTGMSCSDYPGGTARVCSWVDPVVSHGTPK